MTNKLKTLIALLCMQVGCASYSIQVTPSELLSIGPFSLKYNQPDRQKLEADLGKGLAQTKGQGGETLFLHCYSIKSPATLDQPIQSIYFVFDSSEKSALLKGFLLESTKTICPPIGTAKANSRVIKSPVFRLTSLSPDALQMTLPGHATAVTEGSSSKNISKEYEARKKVGPQSKGHSPEVAYQLHRDRTSEYVLDTITSVRADYKNNSLLSLLVLYRETY